MVSSFSELTLYQLAETDRVITADIELDGTDWKLLTLYEFEPGNPLGQLQEALELSFELAPLEQRLRQARKEGLIQADYLGQQIEAAMAAEVINEEEATRLREYHAKVSALMAVDDFDPSELGREKAKPKKPRKAAKSKASPKKKVSARPQQAS